LKDLRGYGPIEHDFSRARSVVEYLPSNAQPGKSLILQGHCDVVPTVRSTCGNAAVRANDQGRQMYAAAPAT